MNEQSFIFEMQRLNENFKNFYSKSKIKIIQNIVAELPENYFYKCVENVLWADRPPKIEWFHEIVAKWRRTQNVFSEIEQMHPADGSVLDDKFISLMKEYASRKMIGQLSDQEYSNFQQTIREYIVTARPDIKCKQCLDQGWYLPKDATSLIQCEITH